MNSLKPELKSSHSIRGRRKKVHLKKFKKNDFEKIFDSKSLPSRLKFRFGSEASDPCYAHFPTISGKKSKNEIQAPYHRFLMYNQSSLQNFIESGQKLLSYSQ